MAKSHLSSIFSDIMDALGSVGNDVWDYANQHATEPMYGLPQVPIRAIDELSRRTTGAPLLFSDEDLSRTQNTPEQELQALFDSNWGIGEGRPQPDTRPIHDILSPAQKRLAALLDASKKARPEDTFVAGGPGLQPEDILSSDGYRAGGNFSRTDTPITEQNDEKDMRSALKAFNVPDDQTESLMDVFKKFPSAAPKILENMMSNQLQNRVAKIMSEVRKTSEKGDAAGLAALKYSIPELQSYGPAAEPIIRNIMLLIEAAKKKKTA